MFAILAAVVISTSTILPTRKFECSKSGCVWINYTYTNTGDVSMKWEPETGPHKSWRACKMAHFEAAKTPDGLVPDRSVDVKMPCAAEPDK